MKKIVCLILALLMVFSLLTACGQSTTIGANEQQEAEASGLTLHKIGVVTYNIKDAQVMMFKDYLDNYIKECFVDVTFLYSESINNSEELMSFLATCAENGVEGIMAFTSYDLAKEVEFCAEHEMYYIRPSATSADAEFEAVVNNPYFVGEIGPGADMEYAAGADMVNALASKGDGKRYIILSGGAFMGNEMHRLRTVAFLEQLSSVYGVSFDRDVNELATVSEITDVSAGDVKIVIVPGYVDSPIWGEPASEVVRSGEYTTILATIPVTPLMDALQAVTIECGTTDCFSEDNFFGFKKDKIAYVAGKYQSEIGPAFAALFNAVTGNAELYRENGRAFRLQQGFWVAENSAEYDTMYALACGAAINAYNHNDLYSVVKSLTPEADFDAFKALVAGWTYDDCLARRAE